MRAQLRWDPGDSAGERTLTGVLEMARFNQVIPDPAPIGEEATAVGDGVSYLWEHRVDYSAELTIIVAYTDDALIQEFLEWANRKRFFALDAGDLEDNVYEELQVYGRTRATVSAPDPATMDRVLSMKVLNVAAVPIPIRIQY